MLKYLKFKYLILIIIILLISFYLLYNFRIYSLEIFNEAGLLFKYDYVLAIIFYCFFCIVFFYNIQNAKYLFIIYNFIIIYNIDNIYEFIDLKLAHFSIYNDHKFNFITTYENNIVIIKTWSEYVFIINSKISQRRTQTVPDGGVKLYQSG